MIHWRRSARLGNSPIVASIWINCWTCPSKCEVIMQTKWGWCLSKLIIFLANQKKNVFAVINWSNWCIAELAGDSPVVWNVSQWHWSRSYVRPRRKLHQMRSQPLLNRIYETWLSYPKWLDRSLVCTMERLLIRFVNIFVFFFVEWMCFSFLWLGFR